MLLLNFGMFAISDCPFIYLFVGCYGAAFSDVTVELTRDVTIMLTLMPCDVNNASLGKQ